MLIECIAKVSGTVETAISNDVYVFRADAHGRLVCDVDREEHQAAFLSLTGVYRAAPDMIALTAEQIPSSTHGDAGPEAEGEVAFVVNDDAKTLSPELLPPVSPDTLAGKTWDELAALYEAKFDRKPHSKTSLATLIERLT
jgi:hypothetical protein